MLNTSVIIIFMLSLAHTACSLHLDRELLFARFNFNEDSHDIDLSSMDITSIDPDTFAGMASLELLNLAGKKIDFVYPGTFGADLANLRSLDLSGNKLTSLKPSTFSSLASLRSLNLDFNGLTSIRPD
jgi:Leucine-rich repeat (LRR) protein